MKILWWDRHKAEAIAPGRILLTDNGRRLVHQKDDSWRDAETGEDVGLRTHHFPATPLPKEAQDLL